MLENTADQVLNFERLASWTNLNSKYRAGNLLEMLENTSDQVLNFSCSDSRAGFLDQSHSIVKWNQSRPGSLLTAQLKIVLNIEKKRGVLIWLPSPPQSTASALLPWGDMLWMRIVQCDGKSEYAQLQVMSSVGAQINMDSVANLQISIQLNIKYLLNHSWLVDY